MLRRNSLGTTKTKWITNAGFLLLAAFSAAILASHRVDSASHQKTIAATRVGILVLTQDKSSKYKNIDLRSGGRLSVAVLSS